MVSREQLRNIKKMSTKELNQFLIDFYHNAHKDGLDKGLEVSSRVDEESKVIKAAEMTKGIGTKRILELIENYRRIDNARI